MASGKPRKEKSTFRKMVNWLHLWLGLISGLVVFIVSLTGCLFVFHEEINNFVNREVRYVEVPVHAQPLPVDTLVSIFKKAHPEARPVTYVLTPDPQRSIQMMVINPSIRKDKFTVKWKARRKRFNLDLHNVSGFYSLPFLIVIAFTGLIMAYPVLSNSVYVIFGGKKELEVKAGKPSAVSKTKGRQPLQPPEVKENPTITLQEVLNTLKRKYPSAGLLQVSVPSGFSEFIYVGVASNKSMITTNGHHFLLDKYTGKEIADQRERRNEQIRNTNIALHIGTWSGMWYKIIAFLASLVATSLPVTGFLIWWWKKN